MKWFYQSKIGGLGNFIMATPALQLLYARDKSKIKVYFDNDNLMGLYTNCYFIEILKKKPSCKPFASSIRPNRIGKESDSQALCRILISKCPNSLPNTFVDSNITVKLNREIDKKYIAIFHGCLGGFKKRKDVGQRTRQYMIDSVFSKGYVPVLLGNNKDNKNYWKLNDISRTVNYLGKLSLKDSVSILSQCDAFISNDTGLYHVAGSFKKRGLVLWHDTNFIKNKAIFMGIEHCISKDCDFKVYRKSIDSFLEKI